MNPIVRISNLSTNYEGKQVLKNINLTIYENDFLGIIGPNGGGKTTLIKCILGLKPYNKGTITFYKNNQAQKEIIIGYLPQYNLIDKKFPISVEEVILSGLQDKSKLFIRYNKEDRAKANKVIIRMGLNGLEKRPIGQLSGGQLQRTLLGRAIISEPDLLILDEPSTYIDKKFEAKLYKLLGELQNECAIILVSHDIGTVLQHVKTIACVNETIDYHPDTHITTEWIERNFDCPIELLGFGSIPHRVLGVETEQHKH